MNIASSNIRCAAAGGLLLLLAALDKDRGAAIGAFVVLKRFAVMKGSDSTSPKLDTQMCLTLLQLGAAERLSQLLQPVIQVEDGTTADDPGEKPAAPMRVTQLMISKLVLYTTMRSWCSCNRVMVTL